MLPIRNVQDQSPLEASKWLKIQLLIDSEEMKDLFSNLGSFYIYTTSGVSRLGEGMMSHQEFLEIYADYVNTLKAGLIPDESKYRTAFSASFTTYPEALYCMVVGDQQQVVRISKPVVQLQNHRMNYSPLDEKFHSMVFGTDSIPWGLQFSYPQLYRDSVTKKVEPVQDSTLFPNTQLYKTIQKWIRQATIPTPFIVDGRKMNLPVRIGKLCLPWINVHSQLIKKKIMI